MLFKNFKDKLILVAFIINFCLSQSNKLFNNFNYFEPKSLSMSDLEESILNSKIQNINLVDYLLSDNKQVIIFGEDHSNVAQKEYFAKILPEIKKKGINVVALEMFSEDYQDILNKYLKGDLSKRNQIDSILKYFWYEIGKGVVEGYMDIVDVIKKENMQLIALDVPVNTLLKNLKKEDRLKLNEVWADKIEKYVKTSGEGLVIYCGFGHLCENSLVNILTKRNVPAIDVMFCGGDLPKDFKLDRFGRIVYVKTLYTFEEMRIITEKIDWIARNKINKIDTKEFLLKLKPEDASYDNVPNYFLWIPPSCKSSKYKGE
ncbi:MAG: ChaN family lipoprotein [Candidatus Pacearchaeota archaeon]